MWNLLGALSPRRVFYFMSPERVFKLEALTVFPPAVWPSLIHSVFFPAGVREILASPPSPLQSHPSQFLPDISWGNQPYLFSYKYFNKIQWNRIFYTLVIGEISILEFSMEDFLEGLEGLIEVALVGKSRKDFFLQNTTRNAMQSVLQWPKPGLGL